MLSHRCAVDPHALMLVRSGIKDTTENIVLLKMFLVIIMEYEK